MAHDNDGDFASKGIAGSALGLGIAGTALALLNNNGGLGNLFGGGYNSRSAVRAVEEDRYVIENERRIAHMEAELAALRVGEVKDARIANLETQLAQTSMLRYVDDKTCGMVRGQTYINPHQMADPYLGSRQVISTHAPIVESRFGRSGFCGEAVYDNWY